MDKRNPYLPGSDADKVLWLNNFNDKLNTYATTLGIDAATLSSLQADYENFSSIIVSLNNFREYSKQLTAYKNALRNGTETGGPLQPAPTAPASPALPFPAIADVFGRVAKLVQLIKNNANYNETIGEDLGIIGEEQTIDLPNVKPLLNHRLEVGKPVIIWQKQNLQGVKIFVNRGTGFQFLAVDTQPDYVDTHPLPPVGQSAVWTYKAVYILNDEEVGQFSDDMVVTVAGIL